MFKFLQNCVILKCLLMQNFVTAEFFEFKCYFDNQFQKIDFHVICLKIYFVHFV